ncbi:endonuclease III [Candidatus Micrarchaeota archaeon]|nr:endonuclease III [Candidatus Micrarchaeota archaeon]
MRIGRMLALMHREAMKRHAPVFQAESATKETPFTILVFTMLSARTKDETTTKVVKRLFSSAKTQAQKTKARNKAITPKQILALGQGKLERLLYGVGFYRVKAKHLIAICRILEERHGGDVPDTLEGLLELPGVGRKTANIVLSRAFGKNTLGVDVHVHRISNRFGLVRTKKPEDTERSLVKSIPERYIRSLNHTFVAFGQTVCLPRNPKCEECPIRKSCPRIGVSTAGEISTR